MFSKPSGARRTVQKWPHSSPENTGGLQTANFTSQHAGDVSTWKKHTTSIPFELNLYNNEAHT